MRPSPNNESTNSNSKESPYPELETRNSGKNLDQLLQDHIKVRMYKPLTGLFIEKDKLTETINENDVCNELIGNIAPDLIKYSIDMEETIDYSYFGSGAIIEVVSHYISNALIPFFEPEN